MDCLEIRERLRGPEGFSGERAVEAHTRACPSCAALVAGGAALAGSLAEPEEAPVDLGGLFRSLNDQLEAERGPLAWLRSRPTSVRRLLIVAAALPLATSVLAAGLRPDLDQYPPLRMAAILVALLGGALWLLLTGTRPLHRPQPSTSASLVRGLVGVGVGFAIAVLPIAHAVTPGAPATLHCYLGGLVIGLPLLLAAIVLRRHASLGGAVLFAASAGLTSNLVTQLTCSAVDHAHLAFGHATVGLTYAALILGLGAWRRVGRAR